jgi:HEAT repeat protein
VAGLLALTGGMVAATPRVCQEQTNDQRLTPLQLEIEKQRQRLSSTEVEDRREALTRLGSLQRPAASRVAAGALSDPVPIVRATAAVSALSLPPEEVVAALVPLLADKDEFVRQQVAYAIGRTGSRTATASLIGLLTDKKDSVRGAAAVALGQIGDTAAVTALAAVLSPQPILTSTGKGRKNKREQNPFVLRAAARSLGEIHDRAAVPALIVALQNEQTEADVRREAAFALGLIGDAAAVPALQAALTTGDPYLAQAAHNALRKLSTTPGI